MPGRTKCAVLMLSALLVLLCASASADTLVVAKSGYWILSQDAFGVPTLRKIDSVVKLDEEVPSPPLPPPALGIHRTAVQTATAAVADPNKANTKKALSELYRTVANLPVTSRDQLVQATDVMFGALSLPLWSGWKAAVDKSLAAFVSLDDAKAAWIVVAEVLTQ